MQKSAMEELICKMIKAGEIQPSMSPYSSPAVMVKRRMVVGDYGQKEGW